MPASIPRSRNLSPKDISRAAQFTPLALAAAIWCSAAQISQVACNGHNSMQPLITEPRALASGFEDNGIFECRTTLSKDSRTMIRVRRCRIVTFCFLTFSLSIPAAETLGSALAAANVPADQFAKADLNRRITSYAINQDDPFLLAYYDDDASGFLKPPLHVIRYDRRTRVLQRSDIRNVDALFQEETPIDCLGSALSIRESHAIIFIDTHLNPSAGCLILLSSDLSLKTALSGWLLGLIGADYAIIERSEIHFMSDIHFTSRSSI